MQLMLKHVYVPLQYFPDNFVSVGRRIGKRVLNIDICFCKLDTDNQIKLCVC